jgi:hypothetical protein
VFRHRQQLRRWATRVLVVWLFGIGASIAQACLAPNHVDLDGQRTAAAVAGELVKHGEEAPPTSDPHHASPKTQHAGVSGHDDSLAESICQDFCEKSAIAIPPLKTALDNVQCHALPPAEAAMVCPVPVAEPVQVSVPRPDGALAPPIRLAFLRLAL